MIVLDASAAADFLVEQGEEGRWVAERLAEAESVHVPHLLDTEVASVLRRLAATEAITADAGTRAVAVLAEMPLRRYPAALLLERIWELRKNLTAYDATYVALAEVLDATLVTTDLSLARAPGHRARVSAFSG